MADQFRIVQPREYYDKFLAKDVRPDDRELGEFRPSVLNIGTISTAEGSSLVKLGNTTILCGVKAEVGPPHDDTPKEGFIVPNVELSPLCSSRFRPGPPGEQAQTLSVNLHELIKSSNCVLLEDLCICPGKLVWVLHIDLVCLDYDGNIHDACTLALMAALKNTSLPMVNVDEESGDIVTDPEATTSLPVTCIPVSTSFIIFDGKVILVDATSEEESLATGGITVTTEGENLISIYKPGGTPLTDKQIDICVERAFQRGKDAVRLINDTLISIDR